MTLKHPSFALRPRWEPHVVALPIWCWLAHVLLPWQLEPKLTAGQAGWGPGVWAPHSWSRNWHSWRGTGGPHTAAWSCPSPSWTPVRVKEWNIRDLNHRDNKPGYLSYVCTSCSTSPTKPKQSNYIQYLGTFWHFTSVYKDEYAIEMCKTNCSNCNPTTYR